MKKIVCLLMCLMLIVSGTVFSIPAFATGAAEASISVSSSSVTVGNQVKVTVKYTSSQQIGSWRFYLTYDSKALQYVDGADAGAGGKLTFSNAPESASKTVTYTVTFKTLKVGETQVKTITDQIINNEDFTEMTVSGEAERTVKVVAKPEASTDNTLRKLSVSPSGFSPNFSSSVTEYSMTVDFSTTSLVVSATPNHSKASVRVNGSSNLSVGENTVRIVVTAESGDQKTYKINVTRKASDLAGVNVDLGGTKYYFGYDTDAIAPPEGFISKMGSYSGQDVMIYSAPNNLFNIVCLVDDAGNNNWFVYDEANSTFAPYVEINSGGNRYAVMKKPDARAVPKGFSETAEEMEIFGNKITVHKATEAANSGHYVLWAVNVFGNEGFYTYDSAEKTLQRTLAVTEKPVAAEPTVEPQTDPRDNIKTIIIFALSGMLLLCGVVIMLLVFRKSPDSAEDEE